MNKHRSIVAVIVLVAMGAVSCTTEQTVEKVDKVTPVNGMVAASGDFDITRAYTGSLEGQQQSVITAKIAEAVKSVDVREGSSVKTGQVLVSLDRSGGSRYESARSVFENSEKNLSKMDFLFREGAVSESEFDAARTQYQVDKANFEATSDLVNIASPLDGIVTALMVSPGEHVRVGQKIVTVATIDRLRVKFNVNVRDISFVSQGDKIAVYVDGSDGVAVGTVTAVDISADTETRSFGIEALIDNKAHEYHPGTFVRVGLTVRTLADVIAVPREAIVNMDNSDGLFIVTNGTAKFRPVALGDELEGLVVVESGLAVGDTVVTLGQSYLDDGFKVKIIEMENSIR